MSESMWEETKCCTAGRPSGMPILIPLIGPGISMRWGGFREEGLMKAIFERKPDFNFKDFVIEKQSAVPAEVFEDMLKHPLEDRPLLQRTSL